MNWFLAIILIEVSIILCILCVMDVYRRIRDGETEFRWRDLIARLRHLEEMAPKLRRIGEVLGLSEDPDVEDLNVFGVLRQRIEVGNDDARTSARYCEGAIFQMLNAVKRELHVVKEAVVLPSLPSFVLQTDTAHWILGEKGPCRYCGVLPPFASTVCPARVLDSEVPGEDPPGFSLAAVNRANLRRIDELEASFREILAQGRDKKEVKG